MLHNNNLILIIITGFIAWYYFTKFKESEKEYFRLHKYTSNLSNENNRLKSRIKDLQAYKNDVSKTFKILDNELIMINDHLKKQNEKPEIQENDNQIQNIDSIANINLQTSLFQPGFENISIGRINRQLPPMNRVSILTPNILNSLFNNINQERQDSNLQNQNTIDTNIGESIENREVQNDEELSEETKEIPPENKNIELSSFINTTRYDNFLLDDTVNEQNLEI